MRRAMRISVAVGLAAALTGVAATLTADEGTTTVQLRDDCDPATFNAVGFGHICDGDGETTFADFIAEVGQNHSAEKWRFNPDRMSNARPIVVQNRGGETHSFTPVAEFGDGSIVPALNAVLGATDADIAQGCLKDLAAGATTFVPSGGTFTPKDPVKGGDKFQCCIHPWMRLTVRKR